MTLITYVTRIHFADGVLEEALRSELEANRKRRPLVITDPTDLSGEMAERFFASLPARTSTEIYRGVPAIPTEAAARAVRDLYHRADCDLLIAFGKGSAIDLAKVGRIAIAHDRPLSVFSRAEGGSRLIGPGLPDLYAVPGIGGGSAAVSAHAPVILSTSERALLMCKKLIPTVTICDPTLTLGEEPGASASAGVEAIARCIEAYLSRSYNPPADGIAIDGLARAVRNLYRVLKGGDIEARREMMAASLNGALALQKGIGVVHAIGTALETVSHKGLDRGALSRLVLPGVLRLNADAAKDKHQPLRQVLDIHPNLSLADGVEAFLSDLPLPRSLSEMGVDGDQVSAAAALAAHDLATLSSPRTARVEDLLSIMQSVR